MVEEFIEQHEGEQRKVLNYLHELLAVQLELEPKIKFKIPFYYRKSWICYLNPTKNSKIEMAFLRGNELSNEQGILIGKGRKQVMGIEFGSLEDIPEVAIREVIHEALLLDESMPYASKRQKK